MTNAAQPERSRALAIVALVTVVVAACANLMLLSRGKPVHWSSWAFLGGLAGAIVAMISRSRALQNALMAVAFVLVLCAIYGVARG